MDERDKAGGKEAALILILATEQSLSVLQSQSPDWGAATANGLILLGLPKLGGKESTWSYLIPIINQ